MTDPLTEDLRVVAFFLADHAAAVEGKVYANGAFWNHINAASFPSVHHFGVAAVLEVPWLAYDREHAFTVHFEDADGHAIAPGLEGRFNVGQPPTLRVGDPTLIPLTVMVNGFVIPAQGDYAAVLTVDGAERDRYIFHARTASA